MHGTLRATGERPEETSVTELQEHDATIPRARYGASLQARFAWVAIPLLGLAGLLLWASRSQYPDSAAKPANLTVGSARFSLGEQADAYRTAISEGEKRSIAVLEAALLQAAAQTSPDTAAIQRLRVELARRKGRLRTVAGGEAPRR
jgi:hypothetical protein